MTNWDRINASLKGLLEGVTPEIFAECLATSTVSCGFCQLQDECDAKLFVRDENGEFVKDTDGDRIESVDYPGCEAIILGYLNKEVGEGDAC